MADEGIPYGALTFKWAVVADKFHLPPSILADLTDCQIDTLFFHPRDKDGGLIAPKEAEATPPAPTRESRLTQINQLEAMGLISKQRSQELRDEVSRG